MESRWFHLIYSEGYIDVYAPKTEFRYFGGDINSSQEIEKDSHCLQMVIGEIFFAISSIIGAGVWLYKCLVSPYPNMMNANLSKSK